MRPFGPALNDEYVQAPCYNAEWIGISKQFEQKWNFPNCIGMFLNYKMLLFCVLFTYIVYIVVRWCNRRKGRCDSGPD